MATVVCASVLSSPVWGQEVGDEADTAREDRTNTIIVTARRTQEDAQTVPISITAFSGEALEAKGIVRIDELRYNAPSFSLGTTNGRESALRASIRGQGQTDLVITQDGAVGIYVDEVYQGRPVGLSGAFVDMETVEVLKGPQGTLFGKNTTGGALLLNSRRPNTDEVEGFVEVYGGNFDALGASGVVNLPLGESAAVRVAASYNTRDGFVRNLTTGNRLSDRDDFTIRASVLLRPTDNLENTTIFSVFDSDTSSRGAALTGIDLTGSTAAAFGFTTPLEEAFARQSGRSLLEVENDFEGTSEVENLALTNITTLDVGDNVTIKNIFGYRRLEAVDGLDLDASPEPVLHSIQTVDIDQISNELLISGSAFDERVTWTTGGIFFREDGVDLADTLVARGFINSITGSTDSANESYGVFVQADVELTDKLTFTGGVRHTWDTRKLGIAPIQILGGNTRCNVTRPLASDPTMRERVPLDECQFENSEDFSDFTYTVGLDYQASPDNLLYIAHRRGYRSGGFNQRPTVIEDINTPFQPEIALDVEIGSKNDFDLGGAGQLQLNLAGYYVSVSDIQRVVASFENDVLFNTVVNAAEATIWGFEVDATWRLTDSLTIAGGFALIQPDYDTFLTQNGTGGFDDLSENSFGLVPERSGNASITWRPIVSGDFGEPFFSFDVYSQSSAQWTDRNTVNGLIPGYTVANASIGVDNIFNTEIDATVRVDNLFDKEYVIGRLDLSSRLFPPAGPTIGTAASIVAPPRTVVLRLRYSF